MTGNLARADLFTPTAGVDADVLAGLALLESSEPLWGGRLEWIELVASLRAFEERWGASAEAAGWSPVDLWGLDPAAPRNRLSRIGGAFLASLPGRQVLGVDTRRIALVTRTSAKLSVYRPAAGGVLAWELRGDVGK